MCPLTHQPRQSFCYPIRSIRDFADIHPWCLASPDVSRCQVNDVNQIEPWRRAAARNLSVVRLGLLAECERDHCDADTMATGAAAFSAETDAGGYIGVGDIANGLLRYVDTYAGQEVLESWGEHLASLHRFQCRVIHPLILVIPTIHVAPLNLVTLTHAVTRANAHTHTHTPHTTHTHTHRHTHTHTHTHTHEITIKDGNSRVVTTGEFYPVCLCVVLCSRDHLVVVVHGAGGGDCVVRGGDNYISYHHEPHVRMRGCVVGMHTFQVLVTTALARSSVLLLTTWKS
jgi:hypothetical protein